MNNTDFEKTLSVYKSYINIIKKYMTKDMLEDKFFKDYGIRNLLNLSYEEYKSLKEETKMLEVNYDYVREKLSYVREKETFIEKQLADEFEKFGK